MFLEIYEAGGPVALAAAILAVAAVDAWILAWSARAIPDKESPIGLFGRVARGYFWIVTLLALPIAILTCFGVFHENGAQFQLLTLIALPIVIFAQGALIGLLVVAGDRLRAFAWSRVDRAPRNRAA